MIVRSSIKAVRGILRGVKGVVGLVPTMGAFHEGHLSLMRTARRECDYVVVSLFVNPKQFGPTEDYTTYPRNLLTDKKMASTVGVDLLWTPSVAQMYPPNDTTWVEVLGLTQRWEGECRPGHFRGVTTVVAKLLRIVAPHRTYLGWKDYQQACVIDRMVHDLHLNTTLRLLPTVRMPDGLAMSSRNARLRARERLAATVLYRSLCLAKRLVARGVRTSEKILTRVRLMLMSEPRAAVDYVALCHPKTLEPVSRIERRAVLLLAVRIGPVRLIDNMLLQCAQRDSNPRPLGSKPSTLSN